LTATADHRVPGITADIYPYIEPGGVIIANGEVKLLSSITEMAQMDKKSKWRRGRGI
jgi:hypothetical protein